MATLSELQARLEAAKKIHHSLVESVQHGDSRTQFFDIDKQAKVIAVIEKEIDAVNGKPRKRLRYAYQSDRGL